MSAEVATAQSIDQFIKLPEPLLDETPLIDLPGRIVARSYTMYSPTNVQDSTELKSNVQIDFQLGAPGLHVDLSSSFFTMNCQLDNIPVAPGNPAIPNLCSLAFAPLPFRGARLQIGSTVVESTTSYLQVNHFITTLLRWSRSAAASRGTMEWVWPLPPALPAAADTVYPPAVGADGAETGNGAESISFAPVVVTPTLSVAANGTVTGPTSATTVTSAVNPQFSLSAWHRAQPFRRRVSFLWCIPLQRIFSYCWQPQLLWGRSINMTLNVAGTKSFLKRHGGDADDRTYKLTLKEMRLWAAAVVPSSADLSRINSLIASETKFRFQRHILEVQKSLTFTAGTSSISSSLGSSSYYPQWLALVMRPASYNLESADHESNKLATPMINVSHSLAPHTDFSVSNITRLSVTWAGMSLPALPYGTMRQSDLARMYADYVRECGYHAEGYEADPLIDFESYCTNFFVPFISLRDRPASAVSMTAPNSTLQLSIEFFRPPSVNADVYQVLGSIRLFQGTYASDGFLVAP